MAFTVWDLGKCNCTVCGCVPCALFQSAFPAPAFHVQSSLAGGVTKPVYYISGCNWSNQSLAPWPNGDYFSYTCFNFSGGVFTNIACAVMVYVHQLIGGGSQTYYWLSSLTGSCGAGPGGGAIYVPLTSSSCSPLMLQWTAGAIGFQLTP